VGGFGSLLRQHRLAAGLTQEELAGRAEVSVRAISDLERGRTARPFRHSVRQLTAALGLEGVAAEQFAASALSGSTSTDAADAADAAEQRTAPGRGESAMVPRQLPAPVRHFSGRSRELATLGAMLDRTGEPTAGAAPVIAICGSAGIGKTALAVRFAHQVADRFPDGQLYVNLRGFDPVVAPMSPTQAAQLAFDAFDVPAGRIPAGLDARVGLYRSLLAGRRVLIVLDNAADADQVRPLLPGSPTCLVIVTSRNRLAGLVALDGAVSVVLDMLTSADAHDLFAGILGETRAAAEPGAIGQIIEACGRLPLALTVTAARAATGSQPSLAALAAELTDTAGRLDALSSADDLSASVRAALDCSYQHLGVDAARTFRLLGIHPGPDVSLPAVASLAGIPRPQAARHLRELCDADLIDQDAAGRYALHDLVRLYAAEQADLVDSAEERHAAAHRMLDHYLYTADAADRIVEPGRERIALTPMQAGVRPEEPGGQEQIWQWYAAERPVLLAAIVRSAELGFDTHAWQLPWTVADFFQRQGHWQDQIDAQRTALTAATRLEHHAGRGYAHRVIGRAYTRIGMYQQADTHLRQAVDIYEGIADRLGEAHACRGLGWALEKQNRIDDALDCAQRALSLFEAADHRNGQATTLNSIGWLHTRRGDYQQAFAACSRSLDLHRQADDIEGESNALESLGFIYHHLGRYSQAVGCYEQALPLLRRAGARYFEADTLTHLGDTYQAAGDPDSARGAWQQALSVFDELQHPDAEAVRGRLLELDAC
jgi:tetratricopeptide (TPR) repeat protein/transcriptional regulator with XRE-family HTH domain